MHPKIAAVLGAHTELGKRVVRELLPSPYIARVHALAQVDPRDDIPVRPRDEHKLAVHIGPLDYIEDAIARFIPRCDLAFCVLGCGKKDMAAMGAYQFHKTNLDIPRRFIHQMFNLRVQRIALLSHAAASPHARNSEFLRLKGELESILRNLQAEAGEHAPGVTIFKVPLMLTDLKDAAGIRGPSITTADRVKQKAARKLELSPGSAVHVRDVAKAMVIDMFHKLHMAETSSEVDPMFRRRDIRYADMDGQGIVELAHQRRAMLQEKKARVKQQLAFDERISGYARKHAGRGSVTESSVRYGSSQPGASVKSSRISSEHWEANADDSKESYMSGSPPDEDMIYDDQTDPGEEAGLHHVGSSNLSHGESNGSHSPLPSSEPRRFEDEGRGSDAGSGRLRSPERRRRSRAPVTSVEALGHQLGRRLTVIRDNEYLPDADATSIQYSQEYHHDLPQNIPPQRQLSRQTITSPSETPAQQQYRAQEGTIHDFNGERRKSNPHVRNPTISVYSPPSRSQSFEMQQGSPERSPDVYRNRFDSPPPRYATASYDRSPSHSRPRTRSSSEKGPSYYGSGGLYRREIDYRGGIRSEEPLASSRPSSLMTRVTAFAERVMAATDRPSMKRRDSLSRKQSFRGRHRTPLGGSEEPPLRGDGDMRPIGQTTI